MTTAIIIILALIAIILFIRLEKRVELDNETIQKNLEIKQENEKLILEKKIVSNKLHDYYQEKDKLDNDLNKLRNSISETIEQNKEISNSAFQQYMDALELSYQQAESEIDDKTRALNQEIGKINAELDKLKATRAAAHEALLKEQEIKDNKDNYRLCPSESDLADSRRLEIVKRDLNKPRIICMLIWQTYWQPLAKKQFPIILQDKTKCGIYKITNLTTDECYIGQAVDVYKRWCEHCKCGLGIDTPPGNKLYKAIQEYGLDNFTFELLEECPSSELNEKEKYFIGLYQADTFGYNGNKGVSR